MPTRQQLQVRITGDSRGLRREIDQAGGHVDRFANSTLRNLAAGITAAFTVRGISRFVSSVIAAGDAVHNAATAARVGYEEYQALDAIIKENGGSANTLSTALDRLLNSKNQAIAGNDSLRRSWENLNISMADVEALNPAQLIDRIARALHDAGGDATSMAAATEIIGRRNLPQLLQSLDLIGRQGLPELQRQLRETGRIMREDTVRSLNEASNAFERLRQQTTVAAGPFVAALADGVTELHVAFAHAWRVIRRTTEEPLSVRLRLDPKALPTLQRQAEYLYENIGLGIAGARQELEAFIRGAHRLGITIDQLSPDFATDLANQFAALDAAAREGLSGSQRELDAFIARAERLGLTLDQLQAKARDGMGSSHRAVTGGLSSEETEAEIRATRDAHKSAAEARQRYDWERMSDVEKIHHLEQQLLDASQRQAGQTRAEQYQSLADQYEIRLQMHRLQERINRDDERAAQRKADEADRAANADADRQRRNQEALEAIERDIRIAPASTDAITRIGGQLSGATAVDPNRAIYQRQLEIAERSRDYLQRIANREPGYIDP